jgi:predicted component of type VI protein secretion system
VETRHLISTEISEALARWEPRIAVESVVVDPDPQDAEAVIATLNYRLISTQARQSASFNIPLTG